MRAIFFTTLMFCSTVVAYSDSPVPVGAGTEKAASSSSEAKLEESATTKNTPEVKTAEPVPSQQITGVTRLQELVPYYQKEIETLKQMIDRWEGKMGATVKRREGLQQDADAKLRKIDELKKTNTKTSKREADRLKKEVGRINKDIAAVTKELKAQCKVLAAETKDFSKESQQALKDGSQQVISDIQKSVQ